MVRRKFQLIDRVLFYASFVDKKICFFRKWLVWIEVTIPIWVVTNVPRLRRDNLEMFFRFFFPIDDFHGGCKQSFQFLQLFAAICYKLLWRRVRRKLIKINSSNRNKLKTWSDANAVKFSFEEKIIHCKATTSLAKNNFFLCSNVFNSILINGFTPKFN